MRHLSMFAFLLNILLTACSQGDEPSDIPDRGRLLYEAKCLSCHGTNGAGTPEAPTPLFGDRPVSELADIIDRTMPQGAPDQCTGDDARAVAEWMQQAFYSPEAQARLNPPRIELARLTVTQYRNAIADLGTSFRWQTVPGSQRGLNAEYFAGRNNRKDRRVFQRLDDTVNFQFGAFSPDGEKISEDAFAIAWEGSLIPRESGWYEFVVRTENGARLFVNNRAIPLIDASVRSGSDVTFRGSRYLLSGRLYPIRLHWFKSNEPTASVQLLWTTPGSVEELIPERHLVPEGSAEVLIAETPFPPDDRSSGYERGSSVSPEWDEATTNAAVEVADRVVAAVRDLAKIRDGDNRTEKIREFGRQFAERAFRRQLDEETRRIFVDEQFALAKSDDEGLRRVVISALKSPRFLYREVTGIDDQLDRASRLAFAMLNSFPDAALMEAATKGQLATEDQIRQQAWRLAGDGRARSRMLEFLRSWMNLERIQDIDKNTEAFPDYTDRLTADLKISLELFLEQVVDSESGDFRQLLLSDTIFMNGRMAQFYGAGLAVDADFQEVRFEPERRAGIVSHPFLLSGLAYTETSSPIHRGVFLSRGILGRGVKPPPIAVSPTAPELAPDLTTRQRVIVQTGPEMCANCHALINPLGFALENFDAVGRHRDSEKGQPIDATGQYLQRNGGLTRFNGARELATFLARNEETHRAFVRQFFHHMVQQPILAYGSDSIQGLSESFKNQEFRLKNLQVEIAVRSALRGWSTNSQPVVANTPNSSP